MVLDTFAQAGADQGQFRNPLAPAVAGLNEIIVVGGNELVQAKMSLPGGTSDALRRGDADLDRARRRRFRARLRHPHRRAR